MRKFLSLAIGLFAGVLAFAQNPLTTFQDPDHTVYLPCGVDCGTITVHPPHLRQSTDYLLSNPAYFPFAYSTPGAIADTSIYIDDRWSPIFSFPFAFSFCFFGINYTAVVHSSNGSLTFDSTLADQPAAWEIGTGGPHPIPTTFYPNSTIFGPFHDILPAQQTANRKIEHRVEGVAPHRRYIASWNDIAYFGTECAADSSMRATHMIVLYENSGVVEVYIKDKPSCPSWNDGLTILGMQNRDATRAVTFPGKNATVWGSTGMDSCFRFMPYGGAPRFKRADLRRLGDPTIIATTNSDTSTSSPGVLEVNFPNQCITTDSAAFTVAVYYNSCSNPALNNFFYLDTVYMKRTALTATVTKIDETCSNPGQVVVHTNGGAPPIRYSVDGGTTFGTDSVINVPAGTYNVVVNDGGTCPVTQTITVGSSSTFSLEAGADTIICRGAQFVRVLTGGTAVGTTYLWTPATGVSDSSSAAPVLTPQTTTTYSITATLGTCTATDAFTVTVSDPVIVDAGPYVTVLSSAPYTMQATATGGDTYLWTPPAGLSATNVLNPVANPQQTTTYTLTVSNAGGCSASDTVTVNVIPDCIDPMTAFTPNGDGINDLWLITSGNCLRTATAEVYNRLGGKVFESKDYHNDWNGTYKGKPVADGTYYFVIFYELQSGKKRLLKGNLTILR